MAKFTVAATVFNDPKLNSDAHFKFRIVDNDNYVIDEKGGVSARKGYHPQLDDKFTVEVSYTDKNNKTYKKQKTFTVTL